MLVCGQMPFLMRRHQLGDQNNCFFFLLCPNLAEVLSLLLEEVIQ